MRSRGARLAGAIVLLFAAGATAAEMDAAAMELESTAFDDGGKIPRRFTCQGQDTSPELRWSGLPQTTQSLVLIVDDPDAPDPEAPKRTWVHWVLYDIPPNTNGLIAAAKPSQLPPGTRQGHNDWRRVGYGGPCPPIGEHRYFFKLYALDAPLGDLGAATKAAVERAMQGHVLERAELVGLYLKHD